MHPESLAALLNKLGVPTRTARTATIHQHLLDMPAPLVADALGYHPVTAAKIASHAGASWSRYAAEDHTTTGDSSIRELTSPGGLPDLDALPLPSATRWISRWRGAAR
jgi:hypothetical protein